MNCKRIEELLPLYVSRDLEGAREQLVAAHVESCAACSGAAGEYRQTRQLLQEFAALAFSEDVYSDIRRHVWLEIEAQSGPSSISKVTAAWFRPRLTWAVATVALIVAAMLGIYFFARQDMVRQEVVISTPSISRDVTKNQTGSRRESSTSLTLAANGGVNRPRQVYIRHFDRRGDRQRAPYRVENLVARTPDAASLPSTGNSVESTSPSESQSGKTLRMELQTRDPNIRIIWFVPRETKPISTGSKGT